ncbi:MAG: hypothetical protein AAF467_09705 [Actinomycetota bacterium]
MTATDSGSSATPASPAPEAPAVDAEASAAAQQGFSRSIVISGIRCVLTYVILPFVTPLIGLAPGVGPSIGLVVGTVAIAANVFSIRRFWKADHHWKKPITVLHVSVIVLLSILLYLDITALLG